MHLTGGYGLRAYSAAVAACQHMTIAAQTSATVKPRGVSGRTGHELALTNVLGAITRWR